MTSFAADVFLPSLTPHGQHKSPVEADAHVWGHHCLSRSGDPVGMTPWPSKWQAMRPLQYSFQCSCLLAKVNHPSPNLGPILLLRGRLARRVNQWEETMGDLWGWEQG